MWRQHGLSCACAWYTSSSSGAAVPRLLFSLCSAWGYGDSVEGRIDVAFAAIGEPGRTPKPTALTAQLAGVAPGTVTRPSCHWFISSAREQCAALQALSR